MRLEVTSKALAPATLADYTREGLIVPHLREQDTAGIISELSQALQRQGVIPDLLPFYHAALNQELLSSSLLESGVAFPHGRGTGVRQLQFAFGRLPQLSTWGPGKSSPVEMVFLLAVPATDAASYLHLLASIARLGHQPDTLAGLRTARTSHAILEILSKIRVHRS